jgi:hypothetical protein
MAGLPDTKEFIKQLMVEIRGPIVLAERNPVLDQYILFQN